MTTTTERDRPSAPARAPHRGRIANARARLAAGRDALRYRVARAVRGDRPMVVALLGVLVLAALVLAAPAQSYLDARERVAALEEKSAALDEANAQLEQRVEDLNDPQSIELLAREQQGLVRPGEVAYSLVPPEVDRPRITDPRDPRGGQEPGTWYVRAWEAIAERFRG